MALKRVQGKNEWVNAEKGNGGSVRYAKEKNQWELTDKTAAKHQRKYFPYEALEEANRQARRLNESVREHGERFGALSDAELQAVMAYRAFTREKEQEGIDVSNMAEFMAAALQTARESRGNSSFAEAARLYLAHFEKQGHSVRHVDGVRGQVRRLCEEIGNLRIDMLTPERLEQCLYGMTARSGKELSSASKDGYKRTLHALREWCVVRRMLNHNPATRVLIPKARMKVPGILLPQEAKALLNDALHHDPDIIPAFVIGLFCGVRRAERTRLTFRDIDCEKGELTISHLVAKTGQTRFIPVPECALAWLKAARAAGVDMDSNRFILVGDSEEQREGTFKRSLKRCRERTGVLMPQNAFRHSAASYLCAKYEDYPRVSTWMGHSVAVMMRNYRNLKRREEGDAFFNIFPE